MGLFFNEDYNLTPDYEYWIKQHFWRHTVPYIQRFEKLRSSRGIEPYNSRAMSELERTVKKYNEEALLLLMNLEPRSNSNQNLWHNHPQEFLALKPPLDLLQDALSTGDLKHMKKGDDWLVRPHICITWAQTQGLRIPEPFLSLINEVSGDAQLEPKEYKGRNEIKKQFAKKFYINSWSGIQGCLKRNSFTLRHIPRGKKPIPVISEDELNKLNK